MSNLIAPLRGSPRHLLVVAALLGLVGCSAGPPQELRGPGPMKGRAFRIEDRLVMKKGKIVMRIGARREEGTYAMSSTKVEDEEILEVEGRQVTKQQTTVITHDSGETIQIGGEYVSRPERGPLAGEKVLRERKGGKWQNTLVGPPVWSKTAVPSKHKDGGKWQNTLVVKAPTPAQQKELDFLGPVVNPDDFYPEGLVKPGQTWKVDPAHLRKQFGPRLSGFSGEETMTFVRTTTLDGEVCALLHRSTRIKGKVPDDKMNELTVELTFTGDMYRSLRLGYNLKSSLSGTMKLSGTVVHGGQRVEMEVSGPVTLETITKLK